MAAISAGSSNNFKVSATASDNSSPQLSNIELRASDPSVVVGADNTDVTLPNAIFYTVTVPASDTQTTFTLTASATVVSNTSPSPQTVSSSLDVTISPATVPVTFTLSITEQ